MTQPCLCRLDPDHDTGKTRCPGVEHHGGHLPGTAGGLVGEFLVCAGSTPSFMADHRLVVARLRATVIAVFATAVMQDALKPISAAGTALVVVPGAETASLAGAGRLALRW